MASGTIEAGFLNIVATPHPEGVYKRLLEKAAEKSVGFWGAYKAAITKPTTMAGDKTFLSFQLVIWMEVNPDEPAINKAQLRKAIFPREGRAFTEQYGVNGRVFYCIFETESHTLTVELKNEDGQSVSSRQAERIFAELLSPEVLGVKAEEVEVTLIPTDDALEYVLGLERIDKIEILVKRPNQDDITTETNRVMKDLMEQNAKCERRILTRQAHTDGLELNDENEVYARVGAHNGHVDSSGVDEHGVHDKRSTREVPKIVKRTIDAGASFLATLRGIARDIRDNREQL